MKPSVAVLLGAIAAVAGNGAAAETLTIGVATEATSMDPHYYNWSPNFQVLSNVYDYFIELDDKQMPKASLAESWAPVQDNFWEFKLRKGVKFHDGTPFTADDVIFTFERARTMSTTSPPGRFLLDKKFKKIDDYSVQVTTGGPYPLMPRDLSVILVVSKKNGEKATTEDYNNGKAGVGTGPHKFVEWVKGDRAVIERNDAYWGAKPAWDKVVYKAIGSDPARIAAMLSKSVDMIDFVPTTDVARLRKDPAVALAEVPGNRIIYIHPDTARDVSPFVRNNDGTIMRPNALRDWRVRKALSLAIDRGAIVSRVMEGAASPAAQVSVEGMFGRSPNLKPDAFDPERAKKLLAEAGFPSGFRLTLHGPNDRYVNDAQIVETVAAMWTRVGVRTEVVTMPKAVYFTNSLRGGELDLPQYSMFLFGMGSETGETSALSRGILHTINLAQNFGHVNGGRYSNPRVDVRIENALVTIDDKAREKLLQEAVEIAMEDQAIIPLHFQVNIWALRKGLTYVPRIDERTIARYVSKAP